MDRFAAPQTGREPVPSPAGAPSGGAAEGPTGRPADHLDESADARAVTLDPEELRLAARHLRSVADHVQSDGVAVTHCAADPGGDHAIDAVVALQHSVALALEASAGRWRRAAADLDLTAERWRAAEADAIGTGR